MAAPDPVVAERQYYLDKLGLSDSATYSIAELRSMTGGGASVKSAAETPPYDQSAKRNAITGWYHVESFGDYINAAAATIQAAQDAAEAAGGGIVYAPGSYNIAVGIKQASNVKFRGNNHGAQPGVSGGPSIWTYTGVDGGTLVSPKTRTVDTVNCSIEGIRLNGGGLAAIVLELYRVSYSEYRNCAFYGAKAGTGVGVVLDANVNNQCYFNNFVGCKADGNPVGVRFQNGANANRWQGGKIGNGATGMEFLSLSAGNIISDVDLEGASVKHFYVDSAANVFIGNHLESAPIGWDITANGSGTRRYGNTIASTVTAYVNDLSKVAGTLDELTLDTYLLQVGTTAIKSKHASTSTQVNIDPVPIVGTASCLVQWFRNITTTGTRQFIIYKGDGTATAQLLFDYGLRNLSIGGVGLGTGAQGVLGMENRGAAPTTDPVSGAVVYAESGSLKARTSGGTLQTFAGEVVSKSANATLTSVEKTVLATGGAGGIVLTLPAVSKGLEYIVKKVDAGVGTVTITPASGTIDGAANKVLSAQYAFTRIVCDGTNWFIIG